MVSLSETYLKVSNVRPDIFRPVFCHFEKKLFQYFELSIAVVSNPSCALYAIIGLPLKVLSLVVNNQRLF